ncbi:bifunctional glycosyltransferase/CDP-glycerol:glycerophosphate glycerophosphotransferase [Actinomyces naeslundii]|uniref:CDP-glycerol glycerophosphotransferase family protein n=1 Tax=Actinomyces naeslundii TaxID=1655 RepID=A0AA47FG86_ACTNA|nr:CDP-glycerol glycerophosphotransferase family protein [Actinomyces naeslundii]OMG10279.1 glycosyl transferase [Actinomyces naeslundii]PKY94700.1 glycosyl transferase [Actinomyces naeslundii]WAL42701.1 CDP-glycerol glycerophosphotransferase family protein [Actinomyces naeslundii]
MGGRRLLGAALRAVHRPRLSVIVQAVGAGPHLEGAIRSVLNQSFKDLEVVVVVGQGADTQSSGEQVATRLSTKDRRVRVLPSERGGDLGDLEAALKRARGRLVTIVDGGDALVAGACQRMIQCLDLSGSDVVVARSRSLTPSPGARQRTGPPREPRLGEPLVQVPEVVEDLVAGAVIARRGLWTRPRRLGALRTSPVSLPARTLSVLLTATRIDVLDEEVYTWRVGSVARGPSADTEPAALLTEVGTLAQMAAGAPPSVRRRLVAGRLSRDLVRLAECAYRERSDFVCGLRRTAKRVLPTAEDSLWDSTALLDRLVLWLLTRDDPASAEELEDLIGRRLEDLNRLPLILEAGTLRPEPRFLERITVPGRLTEVQDVDLRLHVSTDTARWVGPRTLEVRGCAWVWGVDPSLTDRPVIEVVGADGRVRRRTEVDRCQAPRADLEAGDPWRSYLPSGITVRLRLEPGSTVWFRVVTRVAGRRVWTWIPQPAGSSRWRLAPSESGQCLAVRGERGLLQVAPVEAGSRGSELPPSMPIDVVLLGARLAVDATLVLSGTVTGAPVELDIVVSCSGGRMTVPAVLAPGGEWTANLDLVDPDVQLGTYTVGWSATPEDEPDHRIEGVCLAGEGIDGPAIEAPIVPAPAGGAVVPDDVVPGGGSGRPARRARIITRRDGSVAVAVIPPLTPRERSRRSRRLLVEREAEALRPAVFMESFGGRSGGDNPAAICEDLAAHDVRAPLWWSVVDGTVPVPSGAVPVVVGSQEWVEALRTSRVIVTNDHLPDWFSKREGQHLLQTWHGTPIKKLLHDAAPGSVSLRYQRLMARQVPQWDLLLAQNREAEQRLRRALGYGGQVRVGEYPRNVRLLGGIEVGRRVRSDLGIGEEQQVILYAPTWRERLRHPGGLAGHSNGQGLQGDVYPAHRTDAVILMRTHHMNRARPGPGLVDVSRYPSIEELMMAADVLVSDYSSIFLDFALTGKPAVVYVPDLEHYRDVERGLYGDWPRGSGLPVALDHDELAFHLNRILGDFDVQAARREVLEVDPAPVLENLAWIRKWITRFLR